MPEYAEDNAEGREVVLPAGLIMAFFGEELKREFISKPRQESLQHD